MKRLLFISSLLLVVMASCKKNESNPSDSPVNAVDNSPSDAIIHDIDGHTYATIKIGNQVWLKKNLQATHYRNGDAIINGFNRTKFNWWGNLSFNSSSPNGAFTYPNGDKANVATYGNLYNDAAVNDSRGICPAGYHVPTRNDFNTLEYNLGLCPSDTGADNQGNCDQVAIKNKLLVGGSSGLNIPYSGEWFFPSADRTGWQFFGFAGTGTQVANFWTSFEVVGGYSNLYVTLESNYPYIVYGTGSKAFAVRCIKD